MGFIFGDLLVFAVLINFTKGMNPISGFGVVSCTMVLIAIGFFFMVKEPDMERLQKYRKEDEVWQKASITTKVKILTSHVVQASKNNIVFPICFIGVIIVKLIEVLFSTFVMLWSTSFVDKGVLKSEDEAKQVI